MEAPEESVCPAKCARVASPCTWLEFGITPKGLHCGPKSPSIVVVHIHGAWLPGSAENPDGRRRIARQLEKMNEKAFSIIVIAELRGGYTDVPPTGITLEIQQDLTRLGYSIGRSDSTWIGGWRLYSPRAVRAGLYRSYIPRSIYSQIASPNARVPSLAEIEEVEERELSAEDVIDPCAKLRAD